MDPSSLFSQNYIQYGFAGFCLILIGLIIWLVCKFITVHDKLIDVIKQSNKVQAQLIDESKANVTIQTETKMLVQKVHDDFGALQIKLASRPCLKD